MTNYARQSATSQIEIRGFALRPPNWNEIFDPETGMSMHQRGWGKSGFLEHRQ